jgi:AP-4 complex subunit mu-1
MLSQIYILSLRGDVVIKKDFRSDVPKDSGEIFFRNYKLSQTEIPPVICLHDVNFMHMVREGLILLCTSSENVSPSYAFDLMLSIIRVIKDFCGRFSEDIIRKNFILVYELLEEMIDFLKQHLSGQ